MSNNISQAEADRLALKCIEMTTQLNYGSKGSREYLEKAKKAIEKENNKKNNT